jgi:hypothetical protein
MSICLRLNIITSYNKIMAYTKECVTPTLKAKYTKREDTIVRPITIVAMCLSCNITDITLLDRHLTLEYLQPKEQHLYGCGGLPHPYSRIGERMSSPSQYIIPRPQRYTIH